MSPSLRTCKDKIMSTDEGQTGRLTVRQTDGQGETNIPPKLCLGVYKKKIHLHFLLIYSKPYITFTCSHFEDKYFQLQVFRIHFSKRYTYAYNILPPKSLLFFFYQKTRLQVREIFYALKWFRIKYQQV